jgi:Zn-dependent protease with chaperone function
MESHTHTVPVESLVHPREKPLFIVSLIISIAAWIAFIVGTFGLGLIYIGIAALLGIVGKQLYIARIKGFGVRVNEQQYTDIYSEAKRISVAMGIKDVPEIYVYDMSGVFNAFAMNIVSRNFVILTTAMLEASEGDLDARAVIVGHELAHVSRKHTKYLSVLLPAAIVPWLRGAYSRACEFTCDAHGAYYGAHTYEGALRGIALLATVNGGRAKSLVESAYIAQARDVEEFFPAVAYTNSSHPFTTLRFARIAHIFGKKASLPKVNKAGMLFAPLFNPVLLIALIYMGIFGTVILSSLNSAKVKVEKIRAEYGMKAEEMQRTLDAEGIPAADVGASIQ